MSLAASRGRNRNWSYGPPAGLPACGSSPGHARRCPQLLAEVYGWFTEGFDTADLQEAKALLEELV